MRNHTPSAPSLSLFDPDFSITPWEVDWSHPANTGTRVMARNRLSHLPSAREWHLTTTGFLRERGVNTPCNRKGCWEIDWSKRSHNRVWACNPTSTQTKARQWHWIDFHTVQKAGIKWRPIKPTRGRYVTSDGYVHLTRFAMTEEEVSLAEKHGLFRGKRSTFVKEHRLVAVKKYGEIPEGWVVRHVNGDKSDNRPQNLCIGTHKDNQLDHVSARLSAMMWREKYDNAVKEISQLKLRIKQLESERV